MAGVSTKEIRNRIRSMESTKQITKAMEMVAASKLRRAQSQIVLSRPYAEILRDTIWDLVATNREMSSPYLQHREVKKAAYVVIAGDRGLAGGYNSNIFKLAMAKSQGKDAVVLPIGKKSVDYFKNKGVPTLTDQYFLAADVGVGDCFSIANKLCKSYLDGEYDEVYVVFTNFVSMLSQVPMCSKLLPLEAPKDRISEADPHRQDMIYEHDPEEVFDAIVPEYLGGIVYGCLCDSRAAEQAARRSAMDSATQNADEMIADLSLKFNRARQAAITQEITEIVAGS